MADNERIPRPLFGQVAIMADFCTQQQIDECLKIQNKGKRAGTHFYLGTVLINKGYLTLDHALKILKYQKVQIIQDPSNNNRYNVHNYSKKKKYRSPESKELLIIPRTISSITVRGDMGLKRIMHESADMQVVPGTLFDIESQTYEMELGGTSVDITSLDLELDPFSPASDAVSFDDIQPQTVEPQMIDSFQETDFGQDPFAQPVGGFPQADPISEVDAPFAEIDDPFASSVEMFGSISETDEENTEMQSKFPAQMDSSFYVSGSEDIEARQDDEEWGEWGDASEIQEDGQRVDRTLDGPVMAELSSEERALYENIDLEDGATMMDSDAGVAMGTELRDMMEKENIDFSTPPGATTFEEAATLMEKEDGVELGKQLKEELQKEQMQMPQSGEKVTKNYDEALAAFETSSQATIDADSSPDPFAPQPSDSAFSEDPFAQVSGGEFGGQFDEEITKDVFADSSQDSGDEQFMETVHDEGFDSGFENFIGVEDETVQDEPADFEISEQWEMPDVSGEGTSRIEISENDITGDITGADFWDDSPEGSVPEFETEQEGVRDDVFTQQFQEDSEQVTISSGEDEEEEEIGEDFIELKEVEEITKHIGRKVIAEDADGIKTLDLFTPDGDLQETVRNELMKESADEQPRKLMPILTEDGEEIIGELIDDIVESKPETDAAVGALEGDVALTEGALVGDIASTDGLLEGEVLDLTRAGATALLEKDSAGVDVIGRQIKRKRKKDFDYVGELSLDEITTLEQEKDAATVREEKTDVDIKYIREEKTDLDIKRSSGWRSLFYGRRASDAKARVNVFFLLFFFIGLAIISGGVTLLSDFIYGEGDFIKKYIGYFNKDFELERASIPEEVLNARETARELAGNYEFEKSISMLNRLELKYIEYRAIFQSERAEVFKKQTEAVKELIDEYNSAKDRTLDEISIGEALTNTLAFIDKYSRKPYSNIMDSGDYIKNAQDEIISIEKELQYAKIPKEIELINMLRVVAAWNPEDLLTNKDAFEGEFQKHNSELKRISSKFLQYWKRENIEVYKRVNVRFKAISAFFERVLILCELLIKENDSSSDFEIKSIWQAIDEVKTAEKVVRKFEEFDGVLKTDWILEKKREINDEYVGKIYSSLAKSYDQIKALSESEYNTKIKLFRKLNEDIEQARSLNLPEKTRTAINDMQDEVDVILKDLERYSNYANWRNAALTNLAQDNLDLSLEYFEKIYPFEEDENLEEINAAYRRCQFFIAKRDAPELIEQAFNYNANLNEYTKEQLMLAWKAAYELYAKMFELLYDKNGVLVEYAYNDKSADGFDVVNECIERKLICGALNYLWTAQYEYELGHTERNFEIFTSASENYKKSLPYFQSHREYYEKQVDEIEKLIVQCEYVPLKLESTLLREQAIELLEMNLRDKAEEALRLVEHSDELWNDALVIEQKYELFEIHDADVLELTKIAALIEEIKRAIRRHLYHEKLLRAQIYEQNEDFDRAITELDEARIYTTDLRWVNKFKSKLQVKKLLKEAKAFADQEKADLVGAIVMLDKAAKIEPLNGDIYILKNKFTYLLQVAALKAKNASEMSLIKGGKVILLNEDEADFKDYYIDKHEVTNAKYSEFLKFLESIGNDDNLFRHPKQPTDIAGMTGFGIRSHVPKCWGFPGYNDPKQPVVGVTFWDAYAYAKWAGKRLPSTIEWEYASAGKERRLYPWGNEAEINRIFCAELAREKNRSYPMLVDSLLESAVTGTVILHMAGNVREWTALADDEAESAVVKGGSFRTLISKMTNGDYEMLKLGTWDDETGFRCAMSEDAD